MKRVYKYFSGMKLSYKLSIIVVLGLLTTLGFIFAPSKPVIPTIPLTTNSVTKFNHSGLLAQSAGWGVTEVNGTWTVSSEASLNLTFPKFSSKAVIAFTSGAFIVPKNPKITVSIFVNSQLISTVIYNSSQNHGVRLFTVPINILNSKFSSVPILFKLTGTQSPYNLGMSLDKRILGIYLESITLKSIS